MDIDKLLEAEDAEMMIIAGDTHEHNKTVIDDVFIREEMELMDKEYLSKHYDVLDLDELNIMGTVGKNRNGAQDNKHISYINDVMKIKDKFRNH